MLTEEEISDLLSGLSQRDKTPDMYCKHKLPCGMCEILHKKCEVKKDERDNF